MLSKRKIWRVGSPRYRSARGCSGFVFVIDVLPQPSVDELDDLVTVPVEEHLMHVSVYPDVLEPDEIILRTGLIQPLRNAGIKDAVIGTFGGDGEDAHVPEVHELVRRLVLEVAAHFVAGTFGWLEVHLQLGG